MLIKFRSYTTTTMLAVTLIVGGCSAVPNLPFTGKEATSTSAAPAPKTSTAADESNLPISVQQLVTPRIRQADLIGRDARNADNLLGKPEFVTQQGAGELRRYANQTCNLLVILYPDNRGSAIVKTIESTSSYSAATKPDIQTCLNGF